MRKLGVAYEHDQLLALLVLLDMYFINNDNLTLDYMDKIEGRIIDILKFLTEVYEDI